MQGLKADMPRAPHCCLPAGRVGRVNRIRLKMAREQIPPPDDESSSFVDLVEINGVIERNVDETRRRAAFFTDHVDVVTMHIIMRCQDALNFIS